MNMLKSYGFFLVQVDKPVPHSCVSIHTQHILDSVDLVKYRLDHVAVMRKFISKSLWLSRIRNTITHILDGKSRELKCSGEFLIVGFTRNLFIR